MFPYAFDYVRAESVDHAIALLAESDGDGRLIAGGHTLLPMMKLRMAQPTRLIDIAGIAELSGISVGKDEIRIGSAVRHVDLIRNEELNRAAGIFGLTGGQIADRQVRNRGTIGGSVINADPAADWPAVMALLDASFRLRGPDGERLVACQDFFKGIMETDLADGEILIRIEVPRPAQGLRYAYQKFRHPASGYAVVGAAVAGKTDQKGIVTHCAIALTGLSDHAFKAEEAGLLLVGAASSDDRIALAADAAVKDRVVMSDGYADADYRRHLARTLIVRGLREVVQGQVS